MPYTPKDATPATAAANREAVTLCDMGDRQDFADAERGRIADFQDRTVVNAEGKVTWTSPSSTTCRTAHSPQTR
jgi:alkyl sulfatase BDS1-like metallo-beta-lactamase superfamily hydrolase